MNVVLRYFTGTGNTERCMGRIADALKGNGAVVDFREIGTETDGSQREPLADLLIIGFPVLGFSAPAVVHQWVRKLPRGEGRSAAVLAVSGTAFFKGKPIPGYSAGATDDIAGKLRKLGYRVQGTYDVSYPENWTQFSDPPAGADAALSVSEGDKHADAIGEEIASGRFRLLRRPASRILSFTIAPIFRIVARRFLGLIFIANNSCTACRLCSESCPVGAIVISTGQGRGRPRWRRTCQGCNRCINVCPATAIQTSPFKTIFHLGLNIAALIYAVRTATIPAGLLGLSGLVGTLLNVMTGFGIFILLTLIQLGPLETFLSIIARTRRGSSFFTAGAWTARFGRYRAPGFEPKRYR